MYKASLSIALGVLAGLISISASAGVIYNWNTINAKYVTPLSGQLEVTDSAWRAGALDVAYHGGRTGSPLHPVEFPDSPVLASEFSVETSPDYSPYFKRDIDIYPPTGKSNLRVTWTLDAALHFDHHNGILTGNLYANNTDTDYAMRSNADGSVWTITEMDSDAPLGACHTSGVCSGTTGYWTIDPSTVPVPGPGSLALFGLGIGLFGLGLVWRRKHGKPVRGAHRGFPQVIHRPEKHP